MGIKLVVEVMDHAPPGLTAAERWLLACLAEQANDESRMAWGRDLRGRLMDRMGTDKWDTVATQLRNLAGKGLEVRVSRGTGADGRTYFAARGTQTTYRIPELRSDSQCVRANN